MRRRELIAFVDKIVVAWPFAAHETNIDASNQSLAGHGYANARGA